MSEEQPELTDFTEDSEDEDFTDAPGESYEQGWDWTPLSELIEPVLGKTPKRSEDEFWGGEIKWASAKDISQSDIRHVYNTEDKMTESGKEESNAKTLPEGTVVVVARGATMGRLAQLGEPMTFNQTCYGLKTNDELLDDYLYYAWQYVFGQVQAVSYGTVFDSITMKSFKDIEIPNPPIKRQKKIADILTAFDDKIETNNRTNRLLEEIAQTLYRSWFVDFDPYEQFKSSELGKIPVEFEIKELSEIAKIVDCLHDKKPDEQEEGNFYIEVNDIGENGDLRLDDKYLISDEDYEHWTRRITAKPGDIIISKDGRVGAVAQIPDGIEGAIGRNLVCIRPDFNKLNPTFLKGYMMSETMEREVGEKTLSRAIFETLHVSEIENLRVPIPPEDERKEFESVVKPIYDKIHSNIKQNIELSKTRDTLLPKLISGEIQTSPDNN